MIDGGKDQKLEPALGADVLRLWVSSVDYSGDVRVGANIMKQVSDAYRKIRNTLRYLIGNMFDFNPATDTVAYEVLPRRLSASSSVACVVVCLIGITLRVVLVAIDGVAIDSEASARRRST